MSRRRAATLLQLGDELKSRWQTKLLALEEGSETELCSRIKAFLGSDDGSKQLSNTKEIGLILRQASNGEDATAAVALSFLSDMYEACSSRHPIRRAIVHLIDDIQSGSIGSTAVQVLKQSIRERIEVGLGMVDDAMPAVLGKIEHILDYLLSFSENFATGDVCIQDTSIELLQFANSVVSMQVDRVKQETVLIQQQKAIEGCMLTVKLATLVMQRCYEKLKTVFSTDDTMQSLMADLEHSLSTILNDSVFVKDCQSCTGLAIVSVYRITTPSGEFPKKIVDLLRPPSGQSSWIENLTDFSVHCILRGLLAVVPLEVLSAKTLGNNMFILLDVIFPKLLVITGRCVEAGSRQALAHTVCLWSSVVKSYVAGLSDKEGQGDVAALHPGSVVVSGLLEYLWANWDDHMDGIRYQMRLIFDNLLATERIILSSDDCQGFLTGLLDRISTEDWQVRGKYGPLYCLVPHFGATRILGRIPSIHRQLLQVMGDRNVAPHAKDLIEKLAEVHMTELDQSGCDDLSVWNTTWVDPVIDVLCFCETSDRTLRLHVVEFCLPVLLKCNPSCLSHALRELDLKRISGHDSLPAMISFVRVARAHGLVVDQHEQVGDAENFWHGIVPVEKLKSALRHADDQVRTDALALICQSHKTTQAVSSIDFELLRMFLPLNMNSQSSAFRALMLSTMKKFFTRLRDSAHTLQKMARKAKEPAGGTCDKSITAYKAFLSFVVDLVFDGLHPGSSFQRASTSLHLLNSLIEAFQSAAVGDWFQVAEYLPPRYLHALILSLEDSYDVNRQTAISALHCLSPYLLPTARKEYVDAMTAHAASLIYSPRTIDSSTGACYLRLLAGSYVTGLSQMISLGDSNRADVPYSAEDCKAVEMSDSSSSRRGPLLCFMWDMLHQLQLQRDSVKCSLSLLANNPMYGTLLALRLVMADLQLSNLLDQAAWREFVQSLIDVSLSIAETVGPVVTHSSPEGYLTEDDQGVEEFIVPMDRTVVELGVSDNSNQTNGREQTGFTPTSQLVLVCSWRCMKEVSLLLGDLVERFSLHTVESSGLLTVDQVKTIGDFFTKQLTECRHRGAFEVAYVGFFKHCSTLWKSRDSNLQRLPGTWMNELLDMLQSATVSQSLSFTRRSAGLPFFIQTVLSTEPSVSGRTWLHRVVAGLLSIASMPLCQTPDEESSLGLPQVHALNTLRALFRETRLGDHIMPFVSDGVIAAITGISSDCWAVRNSSTLLYSALIARVFGAKRAKQQHARHNCMTGRQFFSMFPSLHPFLVDELRKATDGCSSSGMVSLHPSLYPVLLLLSKLYPTAMEGADTSLNLNSFISFVLRCGSSSVMKTRIMAARAIVPLISLANVPAVVTQLLDKIPSTDSDGCVVGCVEQNQLHGVLLQLDLILRCHVTENSSTPSHVIEDLYASLQGLESRLWIATRLNRCNVTRALFINLLREFVLKQERVGNLRFVARKVIDKLIVDELNPMRSLDSQHIASSLCLPYDLVGNVDLQLALLQIVLDDDDDDDMCMDSDGLLRSLLHHEESSMRKMVIAYVAGRWSRQKGIVSDCETWIVSCLYKMALETETDAQCLQAIYQALAVLGHSVTLVLADVKMEVVNLIATVINRALEATNRPELCQAMMSFTSCFICSISEEQFAAEEKVNELLERWILLIQYCSADERVLELRIAAAQSIQTVGTRILLINRGSLVELSLSAWIQLLRLLQDDDVDVRQAAATCVSAVDTHVSQGSDTSVQQIQPTWALQLVPHLLVSIYGTSCPDQLFEWLLAIVWGTGQLKLDPTDKPTETTSGHEGTPRELFVKGDINPYAEAAVKIDLASDTLRILLLHLMAATKEASPHAIISKSQSLLAKCLRSMVELIEAERSRSLFCSPWDCRERFLDIYAVVRVAHALKEAGQVEPTAESRKWCCKHMLDQVGSSVCLPKVTRAIQLLYDCQ